MDFHNGQYDPQLGRLLSVDPLADAGGQQVLSPYHAMGCNPVSMVDPLGLRAGLAPATNLPNYGIPNAGVAYVEGQLVVLGGTKILNFDADFASHQAFHDLWVKEQAGEYERATQAESAVHTNDGEDASGHNFFTEDPTLKGKYRQTFQFGNLSFNISVRDDGTKGILVFAVYMGDVSDYEKTDWIQIIKTNAPLDGKSYNRWTKDYSKDRDNKGKYINAPFYYNRSPEIKAWRSDMHSKFGGITFQDGPNRNSHSGNFYWSGQLSLVGLRNGMWETIQTVRYGFSAHSTQIYYYTPIQMNNTWDSYRDNFYQSTINHLNLFRR